MNTGLLRETFQRARRENGGLTHLGMRFYERLFTKYPEVRSLFYTPPEQQYKKLMASVGAIVSAVENPQLLIPYLHAMGIRHLRYKTKNSHYAAVGENLVAVLAEHLSAEGEWNEEIQITWQSALEFVSKLMIEAADAPEKYESELEAAGFQPDGFCARNNEPWMLAPQAAIGGAHSNNAS